MATASKVIECKAAICWGPKKPLTIERVLVDPPKAGEVRVNIKATCFCGLETHAIEGDHDGSENFNMKYPTILGHEATGVVESVGPNVSKLVAGDHVMICIKPQCRKCDFCKTSKTSLCLAEPIDAVTMPDGTTRFKLKKDGSGLFHFVGTSTFSEYTVLSENRVAKINANAPFDKIVPISCGFITGYGAAVNTSNVQHGDTVCVWGLGAVGLAAVYGAAIKGASRIFGVNRSKGKMELAKYFGVTDFICTNDLKTNDEDDPNEKAAQEIQKQTGMGVDHALECAGNTACLTGAFNSTKIGYGKTVVVGPSGMWTVPAGIFLTGKVVTGCAYGDYKSIDGVQELVNEYMAGKLSKLDRFISGNMKIEQINEAYAGHKSGKELRTVMTFD